MVSLKTIFLSVLAFGAVFSMFNYAFGDIINNYGISPSAQFSDTFVKINETMTSSAELSNSMTEAITTEDNTLLNIIKGGYRALRLSIDYFSVLLNTIQAVVTNELIAIPSWLVAAFTTAILIVMVMLVISLVFNSRVI